MNFRQDQLKGTLMYRTARYFYPQNFPDRSNIPGLKIGDFYAYMLSQEVIALVDVWSRVHIKKTGS